MAMAERKISIRVEGSVTCYCGWLLRSRRQRSRPGDYEAHAMPCEVARFVNDLHGLSRKPFVVLVHEHRHFGAVAMGQSAGMRPLAARSPIGVARFHS